MSGKLLEMASRVNESTILSMDTAIPPGNTHQTCAAMSLRRYVLLLRAETVLRPMQKPANTRCVWFARMSARMDADRQRERHNPEPGAPQETRAASVRFWVDQRLRCAGNDRRAGLLAQIGFRYAPIRGRYGPINLSRPPRMVVSPAHDAQ